jgi:acyl-homoserine lactone acylase PvdQ
VLPLPLGSFLSVQEGVWQNAEPVDADFNASLRFDALKGKVDVFLDDRLVPHVFAEQENDAYFVQGYLHAKFRLWQMEFQTMYAAGRASDPSVPLCVWLLHFLCRRPSVGSPIVPPRRPSVGSPIVPAV